MRPPRSLVSSHDQDTEVVNKDIATVSKNKPIFKLRLPPDLVKDLRKSSNDNSIRDSTLGVLSDEEDEEYLVYDDHSFSSHSEVERSNPLSPTGISSSMENNRNPSLEEDSSLVNSKNLFQRNNSTPKRYKLNPIKQDSANIDPYDPFGFMAAEKSVRSKKDLQSL